MMSGGPPRSLPRRVERTVTRDLTDETVVYNLDTDTVHLLDGPTSAVWRQLDLADTPEGLEALIAEDLEPGAQPVDVGRALEELAVHGLLTAPAIPATPGLRDGRHSRRTALVKIGAAAVAAPSIMTVLAPTAAAASTAPWTSAVEDAHDQDGLLPELEVDDLPFSRPQGEVELGVGPLADGAPCATDTDCASGYCHDVDLGNGVCADESLRLDVPDEPAEEAAPIVEEEPAPPVAEEQPAPPVAEEQPAPPVAEEQPAPPVAEEQPAPPVAEEQPAPPVEQVQDVTPPEPPTVDDPASVDATE